MKHVHPLCRRPAVAGVITDVIAPLIGIAAILVSTITPLVQLIVGIKNSGTIGTG